MTLPALRQLNPVPLPRLTMVKNPGIQRLLQVVHRQRQWSTTQVTMAKSRRAERNLTKMRISLMARAIRLLLC
jgi:hypothetical protein